MTEIALTTKHEIAESISSLDIFAWCITCKTLLIGAAESNSYWGRKVNDIARIHRRGTHHDVYIGGAITEGEK